MKSVIIDQPTSCQVVERDAPGREHGCALLRVQCVGLCGSDLATYLGKNPLVSYPRVIGHELACVVEEVPDGEDRFAPGDVVTVNPVINCGKCYACNNGYTNCCMDSQTLGVQREGGACEFVNMPVDKIHKAPDGLTPEEVAMIEPMAVGYHAAKNRAEVTADDHVVVIGAGPIGLGALQTAKVFGARVAVVDIKDSALERAGTFGADLLINGMTDVEAAVMEWTGGVGANAIIEAVGLPQTVATAVDIAAHEGRVVVVGYSSQPFHFENPKAFLTKEVTFRGSRNSLNVFPFLIKHVSEGKFKLKELVTQSFDASDAAEAFNVWTSDPDAVCKIVLKF